MALVIAGFHVLWLVSMLVLPVVAPWYVTPACLGLAGVLNLIYGDCPLTIWESRLSGGPLESMSGRLFRWMGMDLDEHQTGQVVGFISVVLIVQSLVGAL